MGKRYENFSKNEYIASTGKVTPAKVAPNEPNIEMKLMMIGSWGYIENKKSAMEHVASMKRTQTAIIEKMLELRLKSKTLNISTLANIAMTENVITKGNIFPNITLMNLPFPTLRHSLILPVLKSVPKE